MRQVLLFMLMAALLLFKPFYLRIQSAGCLSKLLLYRKHVIILLLQEVKILP
jgi:hypothetical protein